MARPANIQTGELVRRACDRTASGRRARARVGKCPAHAPEATTGEASSAIFAKRSREVVNAAPGFASPIPAGQQRELIAEACYPERLAVLLDLGYVVLHRRECRYARALAGQTLARRHSFVRSGPPTNRGCRGPHAPPAEREVPTALLPSRSSAPNPLPTDARRNNRRAGRRGRHPRNSSGRQCARSSRPTSTACTRECPPAPRS